ncbi:helix-turn-helix domain-containing protein [Romboutsia sp. Marseille-P6047]|uniref:helix-turn-helix domain-containing protein n=1 Tax=Romboutsia sp. Marseille-P6047 TaxID=2161817 RepID=UPI000F05FCFD|nr:helix-turn-helix transcriptional regulator [Romboutsia sp. Marseille-P6047]
MNTFGDILKTLRKEKNISGKELAEALKVHKGSISNWETNRRSPDKEMLNKIAEYFGVSVDYLLGRTKEKNGTEKSELLNLYYSELIKNLLPDIEQELEQLNTIIKELGLPYNKEYKLTKEDYLNILSELIEDVELKDDNLKVYIKSTSNLHSLDNKEPLILSKLDDSFNEKKQSIENKKEDKDIEKMIDELMQQQGLMLCGEPMSEQDMILLRNSIRSTIEMAKNMKNKK